MRGGFVGRALVALSLGLAASRAAAVNLGALRPSIFKIQTTSAEPSFVDPWKLQASSQSSGTGFYIGNDRILTNAHVVASATYLTVLRDGEAKAMPAHVEFVGHDCDLALLTVEDPKALFAGVTPMRFGAVPKLRSPVSTIGFPMGGEQLSVTEGVVSRVSFRRYAHNGFARHLLVQVDAAINPGNSGGPVVQGAYVAGVAFQSATQAENTGYIIPTPVILRFLKDIEDGAYDGHPDDGLTTLENAMANPATAAFHGLSPEDGGVKVSDVADFASTSGKIRPGDILLALDGQPIGVDGKLAYQGERVDFRTVFDLKQIGQKAEFLVARDGKRMPVSVDVGKPKPHPSPENVHDRHAKFVVWGGLVFTALSRSLLRTWGERWYKDAPLLLRYFDVYSRYDPFSRGVEELVVYMKRLPDIVNAYATANQFGVVTEVDGAPVRGLAEMRKLLMDGKDEFAVIRFFGSEEPLVLSRAEVAGRDPVLKRKYGVDPDHWLSDDEAALSLASRADARKDTP
jgi:S1-C subfamily serine protease